MSTNSAPKSDRPLFLHAQFEIPVHAGENGDVADGASAQSEGASSDAVMGDALPQFNAQYVLDKVDQWFDERCCSSAVVGLPAGVEPKKPEPGDYSYSGMHDHGPLPSPKEGGKFAQIIGFVNDGKRASDKYLTEVIEREKSMNVQQKENQSSGGRKRKLDKKDGDA